MVGYDHASNLRTFSEAWKENTGIWNINKHKVSRYSFL
jgi:hypothetical protein